jgi:hypothetical protein
MGLRGLTPDERTKLLPVLLADVTDSARRAGWDEYLVQASASMASNSGGSRTPRTGRKLAVNEGRVPHALRARPRPGQAALAGVTGGIRTGPPSESEPQTEEPEPESDDTIDRGAEQNASATEAPDQAAPADDADRGFVPASDSLRDVAPGVRLPRAHRPPAGKSQPAPRPHPCRRRLLSGPGLPHRRVLRHRHAGGPTPRVRLRQHDHPHRRRTESLLRCHRAHPARRVMVREVRPVHDQRHRPGRAHRRLPDCSVPGDGQPRADRPRRPSPPPPWSSSSPRPP